MVIQSVLLYFKILPTFSSIQYSLHGAFINECTRNVVQSKVAPIIAFLPNGEESPHPRPTSAVQATGQRPAIDKGKSLGKGTRGAITDRQNSASGVASSLEMSGVSTSPSDFLEERTERSMDYTDELLGHSRSTGELGPEATSAALSQSLPSATVQHGMHQHPDRLAKESTTSESTLTVPESYVTHADLDVFEVAQNRKREFPAKYFGSIQMYFQFETGCICSKAVELHSYLWIKTTGFAQKMIQI